MLRSNLCRLSSSAIGDKLESCCYNPFRLYSKQKDQSQLDMHFSEQQGPYYTAKDVEFCPNRAKEVMQNNVTETTQVWNGDSGSQMEKSDSATECDKQHMDVYCQSGTSVSLYSVMQSNVPEPFTTKDKAPTHLNMPGSSSSQASKYLSEKMQSTHQSKQ